MLKRAFKWSAGVVAALLVALFLALVWVHRDIRSIRPALPALADVVAPSDVDRSGWPNRIRYINTASQPMPRGLVLASSQDPHPERAYVLSHVSFALEWADGRLFLIDTGMPREAAIAFGKAAELIGAGPSKAYGGVSDQLGADVLRVAGIGFTHLHQDHTSDLAQLCHQLAELDVFQAPVQFERGNYTTSTSERQIADATCATPRRLEGEALFAVPGFPGLFVIQASGHTPGSQLFVVHLAGEAGAPAQTWLLAGDIVNHIDGVRKNLPKPTLYSTLVTPESADRLAELRQYLQTLESDYGVQLLVSHDQLQIESSGIESW